MALTTNQNRFVEAYNGNATDAARIAGYKQPQSQGARLLKNVEILNAIKAREKKQLNPTIATREERQKFWSAVMMDQDADMKNRLKASELLGKSQADFIQRVEQDTEITIRWADNG
jgi:phage terminase small subunit